MRKALAEAQRRAETSARAVREMTRALDEARSALRRDEGRVEEIGAELRELEPSAPKQ